MSVLLVINFWVIHGKELLNVAVNKGGIIVEADEKNVLEKETQPHPTRHPCPDLTRDEWTEIGESNGWFE